MFDQLQNSTAVNILDIFLSVRKSENETAKIKITIKIIQIMLSIKKKVYCMKAFIYQFFYKIIIYIHLSCLQTPVINL